MINEPLKKQDLQIILEVNKKAIEIETGVADQNEEIIEYLNKSKECHLEMLDKINKVIKQNDDIAKDIFKLQILFVTGLFSIIVQIVQIFLKR